MRVEWGNSIFFNSITHTAACPDGPKGWELRKKNGRAHCFRCSPPQVDALIFLPAPPSSLFPRQTRLTRWCFCASRPLRNRTGTLINYAMARETKNPSLYLSPANSLRGSGARKNVLQQINKRITHFQDLNPLSFQVLHMEPGMHTCLPHMCPLWLCRWTAATILNICSATAPGAAPSSLPCPLSHYFAVFTVNPRWSSDHPWAEFHMTLGWVMPIRGNPPSL